MLILDSEKLPYSTWDGKNPPAPLQRGPNDPEPSPEETKETEALVREILAATAQSTNRRPQPQAALPPQSPDKAV